MITALAWVSVLLLLILFAISGLPEYLERTQREDHRRTPKQDKTPDNVVPIRRK